MARTTGIDKRRITCYVRPDTVAAIDSHLLTSDTDNRSDLVDKAVNYYCAALDAGNNVSIFNKEIANMIRAIIDGTEGRLNSHLRSIDISLSMLTALIAANLAELTPDELALLRKDAIKYVDDNFRAKSFVRAIHDERSARESSAHT